MNVRIPFILAITATVAVAPAQTFLDEGHMDIGLGYKNNAWDLHIHDEETDTEYEPDEAIIRLGSAAISPAPNLSFLGVASGTNIWRIRETAVSGVPFLGISTEETGDIFESYTETDLRLNTLAGTLTGQWVRLDLVDVRGPGQFAIWSNADGGAIEWMATSNGIGASDLLFVPDNGHQHFNFAFTEAGTYEIDVRASGIIGGTRSFSEVSTFTFQAVPEPGTMAALGLGAIAMLRRRRRA